MSTHFQNGDLTYDINDVAKNAASDDFQVYFGKPTFPALQGWSLSGGGPNTYGMFMRTLMIDGWLMKARKCG